MLENKNITLEASACGTNYYVLRSDNNEARCFGVIAENNFDPSDTASAENIFFTQEEASCCCTWLAENDVPPFTLNEVLENFYQF